MRLGEGRRRPTPLFAPSPGTPLPDLHPPSHSDGDSGKFPFDRRPLVVFPAEIGFQRIASTRGYGVGHPRAILKHPFPTPPHRKSPGPRPRQAPRPPQRPGSRTAGPDPAGTRPARAWLPRGLASAAGATAQGHSRSLPVPGRAEHLSEPRSTFARAPTFQVPSPKIGILAPV